MIIARIRFIFQNDHYATVNVRCKTDSIAEAVPLYEALIAGYTLGTGCKAFLEQVGGIDFREEDMFDIRSPLKLREHMQDWMEAPPE